MKVNKTALIITVGACVVFALLAVFALELSSNQARSRHNVEVQIRDRATLSAALIDSLFQSVQQQIPQDSQTYGGRVVTAAQMQSSLTQGDVYSALLDSNGQLLAASSGFTPQARAELSNSAALALLRTGHPYGLGNFNDYGQTGAIDFAVSFPTNFGTRTLVTGFTPKALSQFIEGELAHVPGVKGSLNYLVDGNNVVLASTNPKVAVGQRLAVPGAAEAFAHPTADTHDTYFQQQKLTNSTWRVVLTSPDGALFASVSGWRQEVPWILFVAFAVVSLFALLLGWRALRSAEQLSDANEQLGVVNQELVDLNGTLERRAAELARSNEELDQFASIASHDLQEPLRKVRTFTEQLTVMETERLSPKGRDYLARTNAAAERMQRLIEDLLRFSRVSTQGRPFEDVDLSAVMDAVISDLETQITDLGAAVHAGPLPTIRADSLQMHQLLLNLVGNALKFHRFGVRPDVTVEGTIERGMLHLTVRDNGIGFEPQYAQRIFRVFERLHGRSEYPGTGIGLSLCRKIADRHGGTISAEGVTGVGSTFTVEFPARGAGPLQNHSAPSDPEAGPESVEELANA
ncbi:MAG TPA: ATP-binding protein [Acidimicrobiales bacterium]